MSLKAYNLLHQKNAKKCQNARSNFLWQTDFKSARFLKFGIRNAKLRTLPHNRDNVTNSYRLKQPIHAFSLVANTQCRSIFSQGKADNTASLKNNTIKSLNKMLISSQLGSYQPSIIDYIQLNMVYELSLPDSVRLVHYFKLCPKF